jgi:hypothetical protein
MPLKISSFIADGLDRRLLCPVVQQPTLPVYHYLLMGWLCHCQTLPVATLTEQILPPVVVMLDLDPEKLLGVVLLC